jgi:hypothetical protein
LKLPIWKGDTIANKQKMGRMGEELYEFLISTLGGHEFAASYPGCFNPREKPYTQ